LKLLFDQNISYKLVKRLEDDFPSSIQVRSAGLEDKTDKEIWQYARQNGLAVVTFDSDFYDFSLVWGAPPKIIWIRTTNQTTSAIEALLTSHKKTIVSFLEKSDLACLEIIKQ